VITPSRKINSLSLLDVVLAVKPPRGAAVVGFRGSIIYRAARRRRRRARALLLLR